MRTKKAGVSNYLEAFLLIGVATAGSGLVLGAAMGFASSSAGPSVSIGSATIRQGTYVAVERVTVYNTGQAPMVSFTMTTAQAPSTASYCYSLLNPVSSVTISSTCPTLVSNPSSISVPAQIPPGGAVVVEALVSGGSFALGVPCQVTVTSSNGAQASALAQVVPS